MNNNKGFSIKELIMVFVVIGILCAAAIPGFNYLQETKRSADFEKTIASLKLSLNNNAKTTTDDQAQTAVLLDEEQAQSICQNCFSKLLPEPLANRLWFKESENTYLYSANGNYGHANNYNEQGDYRIQIDTKQNVVSVSVIGLE
ncbi:MAG: hypothetical protein H7A33_00535 [Deltaproteobacteria bacterium]|nr:hypothetical protein [Deltaproteobacteria bacterium]